MAVMNIREAIASTIHAEMERDSNILILGEDIVGGMGTAGGPEAIGGIWGLTGGLYAKFGPNRVIDTPISESCIIGAAAQHSQAVYAMLTSIPGLKVVMPTTPADAKGLLTSAIRGDDPVMFFEHKTLYGDKGEVPDGDYLLPFGHARMGREGHDASDRKSVV